MAASRINFLFNRWLDRLATPEELEELGELLKEEKHEEMFVQLMQENWETFEPGKPVLSPEQKAALLGGIKPAAPAKAKAVFFSLRRLPAAAAVLILLALGSYLFIFKEKKEEARTALENRFKNDIDPAGENTILMLGDGRRVVLDSVSGVISRQGGTTVVNLEGQLNYTDAGNEVVYNTIVTGRGGQYRLVLPDGSRVWLNAASSLRFPTAFKQKSRRVELTGEGYFEVAHDKEKPFHVLFDGADVEVLGTKFNINTYTDEPAATTSLLEGSVQLSKGGQLKRMRPGNQIAVDKEGVFHLSEGVDMAAVKAWTENRFEFKDAPIETIMRELSRWYDISVDYEGKVNTLFIGRISRNEPISKVLRLLELTSGVHFRIEGKRITVTN